MGRLRFGFTKIFPCLLVLLLCGATSPATAAVPERVSVAAAANLVYALDALHAALHAAEPALDVRVTTGASGNLLAQITHGAPYDVFLSADMEYPRALIAAGQADERTLVPFATGRLVLWVTRSDLPLDTLETLRAPAVQKIALANTVSAPYGRAAQQALERLGWWQVLQPKLVFGENVTQTAQFVEMGGADAGFVALSLVRSPRLQTRGRWIPVPEALYDRLDQGAVLTRRGEHNAAARRYLEFLRSAAARRVFVQFGYGLPEAAAAEATP